MYPVHMLVLPPLVTIATVCYSNHASAAKIIEARPAAATSRPAELVKLSPAASFLADWDVVGCAFAGPAGAVDICEFEEFCTPAGYVGRGLNSF